MALEGERKTVPVAVNNPRLRQQVHAALSLRQHACLQQHLGGSSANVCPFGPQLTGTNASCTLTTRVTTCISGMYGHMTRGGAAGMLPGPLHRNTQVRQHAHTPYPLHSNPAKQQVPMSGVLASAFLVQ
jgi:hypothetical protein